jgi:transcription-repair coupling factor (superfamily II helicase)
VFFLHNRVESIDRVAAKIAAVVPEARIAVAHGQMHENDLEQVMVNFWERRFDVLVCTTIVESGLDIPNANTLIVDRAERFGLSQLHQIRGRVGRGRERAYAYFFYDADKPLNETAYERLSTIAQHTDLGSGMAVAMKDLEIRGAGNLLGGEQSGHIADVGFDLYVRMVGEALAEVKGEASADDIPATRVELPLDAHIPRSYVPDERLRLEAYRRLAEAPDAAAVDEVEAELIDRYGRMPPAVAALAAAARLRIRLRDIGVTEIVAAGARIRIEGLPLPDSLQVRIARLYPGATVKPASRTVLLAAPKTARVGGAPLVGTDLMAWVDQFIDAVAGLQPAPVAREDT